MSDNTDSIHKCLVYLTTALLVASCGEPRPPQAPYLALTQLEATFGPMITAGNHPTPNQNGTGDRVGFFKDSSGTLWGMPLITANNGAILGCAPPSIRNAPVTDTIPGDADVLGSTNEPTGHRGGTGRLELLLRDRSGALHWQAVQAGSITDGALCWAQEPPGPAQELQYYRLVPKK